MRLCDARIKKTYFSWPWRSTLAKDWKGREDSQHDSSYEHRRYAHRLLWQRKRACRLHWKEIKWLFQGDTTFQYWPLHGKREQLWNKPTLAICFETETLLSKKDPENLIGKHLWVWRFWLRSRSGYPKDLDAGVSSFTLANPGISLHVTRSLMLIEMRLSKTGRKIRNNDKLQ